MPARVPLRAVLGLFLERQHLERPRQASLTSRRLLDFAGDTGGIQLDSINVVERAHYLTVWSRFGPYERPALDRLVYERRVLFEYWAHAACLVPKHHFPAWRRVMLDYSTRSRAWGKWLQKNQTVVTAVERAIAERGPLGNADFVEANPRPRSGWWSWKPATHALDYLWMSGRTAIASRVHFQKRFDLAERVLPDALLRRALDAEEFRHWHLERSLHAMGAATAADLRSYLTFPRSTALEQRRTVEEALRSGEVVEVRVESARGIAAGKAGWFALARDLPALASAAARKRPARGTTFLTPFDSLLWYRERAARLFGFDYRIEVYTPGPKRVHGYYVLPIFHDGQLIGRLDAKAHRAERRLEVKRVHFEPWFVAGEEPPVAGWGALDRDAALRGIAEALHSLAAFVNADVIELQRVNPLALKAPLKRAVASVSPRDR